MTESEKRALDLEERPAAIVKRDRPRKTGRAYRRVMKRHKFKRRLWFVLNLGYDPRLGDIDCDIVDDKLLPVGHYLKFIKNSKFQKWAKRATSKRLRRFEHIPKKGNPHHKLFDYWWAMS